MDFISESLGLTLDEVHQRLIDCNFGLEDPELVVLMLIFGESGTAERSRNRLMRWRRGEMSGHDLAREPG